MGKCDIKRKKGFDTTDNIITIRSRRKTSCRLTKARRCFWSSWLPRISRQRRP